MVHTQSLLVLRLTPIDLNHISTEIVTKVDLIFGNDCVYKFHLNMQNYYSILMLFIYEISFFSFSQTKVINSLELES